MHNLHNCRLVAGKRGFARIAFPPEKMTETFLPSRIDGRASYEPISRPRVLTISFLQSHLGRICGPDHDLRFAQTADREQDQIAVETRWTGQINDSSRSVFILGDEPLLRVAGAADRDELPLCRQSMNDIGSKRELSFDSALEALADSLSERPIQDGAG